MAYTITPIALYLSSKLHTAQTQSLQKQPEHKMILGLEKHQRFNQKPGTTGK